MPIPVCPVSRVPLPMTQCLQQHLNSAQELSTRFASCGEALAEKPHDAGESWLGASRKSLRNLRGQDWPGLQSSGTCLHL
eukprot:1146781-Pelagomonas_calceolata.AAC.1